MYIDTPATFTDYYELTMAQGYLLSGLERTEAVFDYFFRSNPFDGGYTLFAGLGQLLETLREYRFTEEERSWLLENGFDPRFVEQLGEFRFRGDIDSVPEGEVVFPDEPLLRVTGGLMEVQLIETLLLNILNFQSLIATKASRLRLAAGDKKVVDFGLRRSQGLGGIQASRAAMIGGLDGTSNVYAAREFNLPSGGTMAHSWVQAFEDELTAFRTYCEHFPDDALLLVDTYDTLGSGVPNAVTVALELEAAGRRLQGIRLDSGDLAYFSRQARSMLDDAGLEYVKIAVSNQLDEYLIRSLLSQKAPVDLFGVGTRLVTGDKSPALDGVYKLGIIGGRPACKISDNPEKSTLPGRKKVLRYFDENGMFDADGILLDEEPDVDHIRHPHTPFKQRKVDGEKAEPLLKPVMRKGKLLAELPSIGQIADQSTARLTKLADEYKRFEHPHLYKVGISESLAVLRDSLFEASENQRNRKGR